MNKLKEIFTRYLIIILIALPNLFIFYFIFTPLTIYPLFALFKLFIGNVLLVGNAFQISDKFFIEIIEACVAGSAYYLLFVLNLSVPNISLKKRLKMLLFSFTLLWVLNITRIFVLTLIFVSESSSFDSFHRLFWYFGATIFVVLIWFIEVKTFKIKDIPIYSDIKFLVKQIKS